MVQAQHLAVSSATYCTCNIFILIAPNLATQMTKEAEWQFSFLMQGKHNCFIIDCVFSSCKLSIHLIFQKEVALLLLPLHRKQAAAAPCQEKHGGKSQPWDFPSSLHILAILLITNAVLLLISPLIYLPLEIGHLSQICCGANR